MLVFFLASIGSPYQAGHESWPCCFSHWIGFQQVQLSEIWCRNSRRILCSSGKLVRMQMWTWNIYFHGMICTYNSIALYFKISSFCGIDCTTILQLHEVPSLQSIYTLDAAISKIQVSLDEHFSKLAAETDPQKSSEITKNLLPATLQLIDTYATFTRYNLSISNRNTSFLCAWGLSFYLLFL